MTESEKADAIEKIKKLMIEHLTQTVGFPNCNENQIMGELKNMWIKLEEANLTYGTNFKNFTEHATNQAMIYQIKKMMAI